MTINTTLFIKIILALVAVAFTGFTVEELFPAAELSDDLLACAAVGFGLAAIILP